MSRGYASGGTAVNCRQWNSLARSGSVDEKAAGRLGPDEHHFNVYLVATGCSIAIAE